MTWHEEKAEDISKKYDFFYDVGKCAFDKKKSYFLDDNSIKQEKGFKFNDAETIPYAFPRSNSNSEIDEKKYKEPKLQTAVEIEKQAKTDEENFMKTELEINKVDTEASKDAEIKRVQDVFNEVKEEESIQHFFYRR